MNVTEALIYGVVVNDFRYFNENLVNFDRFSYRDDQRDEAADMFEELSHAAQWKPVQIEVTGYCQLGTKTVPVVKLRDGNGSSVSCVRICLYIKSSAQ